MSYSPYNTQGSLKDNGSRRGSFLDYGGINSINRFASSYTRAQSYAGSSFLEPEDDLRRRISLPGDYLSGTVPDGARWENMRDSAFGENESAVISGSEQSPLLSDAGSMFSFAQIAKSTTPQTIFNSANTLMGVGMLSLPYGFKLTGWAIGIPILIGSALITDYTSIVLSRIMKKNPSLNSYGDIAFLSGGRAMQTTVTTIFCMDLLGAMISLIIITSQVLNIIFSSVDKSVFKFTTVVILYLLSLLPLNILSFFSLIGIVSTFSILTSIVICGFLSGTTPGSLIDVQSTNMWPEKWENILLALGLFFSPWGGHPVFPELYKDMRHPQKFTYCSNVTFTLAFSLDFLIGAVGYLMFGQDCEDSIIKNLMTNEGYPTWVKPSICVLMSLLCLAKLPLIARPMITVYENILNVEEKRIDKRSSRIAFTWKKLIYRLFFCLALLALSFCFTSFGHILAFLGSAICFTICITLPLYFYLRCEDELSNYVAIFVKIGIVIGITCCIFGTYGALMVKAS